MQLCRLNFGVVYLCLIPAAVHQIAATISHVFMRSAGAGSLRSGDALMFRGIWLPPNTEEARNGWMMDHDFIEQTHLTENNRTSRALRFACFDTHEEYGMDDISGTFQ